MNIKTQHTDIVTVKQGDPLWQIQSGFVVSPRAGFEINPSCPREYRAIISECINNGWLKPVAFIKGKEATWAKLE